MTSIRMRKKVIIYMLALCFLLSGCNKSANKNTDKNLGNGNDLSATQSTNTTIETGKVPANSSVADKETIGEEETEDTIETEENVEKCHGKIIEALSTEGSYKDFTGCTNTYSYHIPQFNDDSQKAKEINDRILEEYDSLVQEELENIEAKEMIYVENVLYRCFEKDDLFTIVIECYYTSGQLQYSSYSYDFSKQKEVTNKELIKMGGMTESQFVTNAKAKSYNMIPAAMEITENEATAIQDIISGISSNVPMYLDEDGVINACIPYPIFADSGVLYQWMKITADEEIRQN